jgi:hypothetical protein
MFILRKFQEISRLCSSIVLFASLRVCEKVYFQCHYCNKIVPPSRKYPVLTSHQSSLCVRRTCKPGLWLHRSFGISQLTLTLWYRYYYTYSTDIVEVSGRLALRIKLLVGSQ